jgi:hypothetical protein
MIRVVHPGSGSPDPDPAHPGSRGQKATGSRIRIRNTAFYKGLCLKMTPTPKIGKFGKEVSLCTH